MTPGEFAEALCGVDPTPVPTHHPKHGWPLRYFAVCLRTLTIRSLCAACAVLVPENQRIDGYPIKHGTAPACDECGSTE